MTKKKGKTRPMSIGRLFLAAETLTAWKKEIKSIFDAVHGKDWEGEINVCELLTGERDSLQTLRLIQALQVSLLDRIELHHQLRAFRRKK